MVDREKAGASCDPQAIRSIDGASSDDDVNEVICLSQYFTRSDAEMAIGGRRRLEPAGTGAGKEAAQFPDEYTHADYIPVRPAMTVLPHLRVLGPTAT